MLPAGEAGGISATHAKLLVLLIASIALVVASVAVMLGSQVLRFQQLESLKVSSITGLAIGLERQFLHFRGDLAAFLETRADQPPAELLTRYEVLVSRIELLRESPGSPLMADRPEHRAIMSRMDAITGKGDPWAKGTTDGDELLALLDEALPDVQSYTMAAASATSHMVESQFARVRFQTLTIGGLALLQLLLVGLGVHAWRLWKRQEDVSRDRLRRLSEQLHHASVRAEGASRAKSAFLANMSHELRTPFQGVLGMLQLLEGEALTAQQHELVQTARGSATHLLQILNDILDASAIEAGRTRLHMAPLSVRELCAEVQNLMRVQANAKGLLLETEVNGVPDWVEGDATRVKQVLFNLLNNAIKFTPSGSVSLAVSCLAGGTDTARLCFEVSDTGIGMDAEMQGRLFRRFEPGDSTLARPYQGAGLGLEISRGLAHLMGGELTASSVPGSGSRFVFSLPMQRTEAPAPVAAAGQRPQAEFRSLRVLVADDHPINRRYLGLVLTRAGHAPTLCADGQEALKAVQAAEFDLVLMDIHMPVMDGIEATKAIRALGGRFGEIPVVALTADVLPETRQRATEAGATAVLAKPVDMEQLAQVLHQHPAPPATGTARAEPEPALLSARFTYVTGELPPLHVQDMVRQFFRDDSRTIGGLRAAVQEGRHADARKLAHELKGCCSFLGFERIEVVAGQLESWARSSGRSEEAEGLLTTLQAALDRTDAAAAASLPLAAGAR